MGQFAIQAARSTAQQLASAYPGKTSAQLLSMVGIAPMIGHNDDAGVFTVSHANAVATLTKANAIPLLAFWDFQRDAPGTSGDMGSGVNTANFQFYKAFAGQRRHQRQRWHRSDHQHLVLAADDLQLIRRDEAVGPRTGLSASRIQCRCRRAS